MSTTYRDQIIPPGTLVSFIYTGEGLGTCLGFAPVLESSPGSITVKAPKGAYLANGTLTMGTHPDFVEVKRIDRTCALCGVDVYLTLDQYGTAIDAEGTARCADGREHIAFIPCQTHSHAGTRRTT